MRWRRHYWSQDTNAASALAFVQNPTTHAMRSTQMISIRKRRTSSSYLRELNPEQSSLLCLLFPTWDIHRKKPRNHPNQKHTHIQSLSPNQSTFYAWEKNLKGKAPENIPVVMEGNKSYWALHIVCWKVQAWQLIIITAFNTELPLLLLEGVSAGRTWLMELLTRAYHVQQQQDCHNSPPCNHHTLNTGWAQKAVQIYLFSFHRLCYS